MFLAARPLAIRRKSSTAEGWDNERPLMSLPFNLADLDRRQDHQLDFLIVFCSPMPFFQVVYAWAKNAPELDLPEGVGFHVGGKLSGIDWLVLQVNESNSGSRT